MHIWSHKNQPDPPVDTSWQLEIGMGNHRHHREYDFKYYNSQWCYSQHHDDTYLEEDRQQAFHKMKPKTTSDIQIKIKMVDLVKSPQKWKSMKHNMLDKNHQIQKYDSCKYIEPKRLIYQLG